MLAHDLIVLFVMRLRPLGGGWPEIGVKVALRAMSGFVALGHALRYGLGFGCFGIGFLCFGFRWFRLLCGLVFVLGHFAGPPDVTPSDRSDAVSLTPILCVILPPSSTV